MIYYLVGEVVLWPNSERIPSDFLPCDGRLLSVGVYSKLFERIGYAYGGSDDEFAIPNILAPVASNAPSDPNPLTYMICTDGLAGSEATFTNAAGVMADIRFLAGPLVEMAGSALAAGELLEVRERSALFVLLGSRFGGDGQTYFQLPIVPSLRSSNRSAIAAYVVLDGYFPLPTSNGGNALGESYLSEVRLNAAPYAPAGWLPTAGPEQTLEIAQNSALFSLLQYGFGGDGQTTFAIPGLGELDQVAYSLAAYGVYPSIDPGF